MRIVECVPNFSEGRDASVLGAIADSIRSVRGARLLHVDAGASTNRTVMTIVGEPEPVLEAMFRGARTAYERIDMRTHEGAHPRLGAVDVAPFVPIEGVSMAECVELARRFGRRVADELRVPIYLYEEAQEAPHRKTLAQIRSGEYEGLAEKIRSDAWSPDFGPAELVPRSGATVTGARFFLVAYNVNVLGPRAPARQLAQNVRESGRVVDGPNGERVRRPGYFEAVKAIGWELEDYGIAQVSMNLDDYRVTPIHTVFEAIRRDAAALAVAVAGSEIVGMVPLEPILMAADHYIEAEGLATMDERRKVRLAVDRLGLSSIRPFDPDERVIEYALAADRSAPLILKTVREFVAAAGAGTSTPGGGSVAALIGAMGAALGAMVGRLTHGRRKYEHLDDTLREHLPPLVEVQEALLQAVDADTEAYAEYVAAMRLPKETEAQRSARRTAMEDGIQKATRAPLHTMELVDRAWAPLLEIVRVGRYTATPDGEVGAKALEACAYGAYRNVLVNLGLVQDEAFRTHAEARARALWERAQAKLVEVRDVVASRTGDV